MEEITKNKKDMSVIIEELLKYASINLGLSDYDIVFTRNLLMHELNVIEPYNGEIDVEYIKSLNTITPILKEMEEIDDELTDHEEMRILSFLSPKPSEIINKFYLLNKVSSKEACDYFYNLMIKNDYIRLDDIKRNMWWLYEGENNTLEITINLSKPEKNNKDIAKLRTVVSTSYPKCRLCLENEGYYGGGEYPARSNIRVIPMKLNNEDWFFQYSPYAYYDEHAIIINNEHTPMNITKRTLALELDFLDQIPHYFIGSNSDLPIVGGSLLTHEHFQAGIHLMPMMHSRTRYVLTKKDITDVDIEYLDWYNSCFLLKSKNKEKLLQVFDYIQSKYYNYSDESIDLIANDNDGRHQAITCIARKVDGVYYCYMILRNNRCNNNYPDGIFHAHPQYHNIKSEGIGLIEAMGLFILPGRLKNELNLVSDILSSNLYSISEYIEMHKELNKHLAFINKLVSKYSRNNTKESAVEIVKLEVGRVCEKILKNTGVFKDNLLGQDALFRFFDELSFEVKDE